MRIALFPVFAGVLMGVAAPVWAGEFYQWRDSAGRVQFTDDPAKVPAEYRESGKRKMGSIESTGEATQASVGASKVLSGKAIWQEKCAECHHTGFGFMPGTDIMGLGPTAVDDVSRMPKKPEEILFDLRFAVDGRKGVMRAVDMSDEEILAVAKFLTGEQ